MFSLLERMIFFRYYDISTFSSWLNLTPHGNIPCWHDKHLRRPWEHPLHFPFHLHAFTSFHVLLHPKSLAANILYHPSELQCPLPLLSFQRPAPQHGHDRIAKAFDMFPWLSICLCGIQIRHHDSWITRIVIGII